MSLLREGDYTAMPGGGISGTGIFQVTIFPGIPAVGANILPSTWLGAFKKVSGLGRDMEVQAVSEGGYNHAVRTLFKPPSKHGEVTLESGSVGMPELWAWARRVDVGVLPFRTIVFIEHFKGPADAEPVRTYTLLNAWPVKWKSSDLDAQGNSIAVDSLTLAYDDLLVDNNPLELLRGVDLVRGTLTGEDDPSLSVEIQFNPKNVKVSRALSWEAGTGKKESPITSADVYPYLRPPAYKADTLNLDGLIFDASESITNASLLATLKTLHRMTLHETPKGAEVSPRPPLVRFAWGDLSFVGGISSLTMDHTLFDTYGGVRRAQVSLALTGQLLTGVTDSKIQVNTG